MQIMSLLLTSRLVPLSTDSSVEGGNNNPATVSHVFMIYIYYYYITNHVFLVLLYTKLCHNLP